MSYSVYCVSADKFGVMMYYCVCRDTTKENALAICKERAENESANKSAKKRGRYIKYIPVVNTCEGFAEFKARIDKNNAIRKPVREQHQKAMREKMDRDAYWYHKECEYLRTEGFHYDNQQRVNEYKGTMRG